VLNFMLLEAATRSMTLEELADFSARYRLRVEAFPTEDSQTLVVVCDSGAVDWSAAEVAS
jgi:hypothetical protein